MRTSVRWLAVMVPLLVACGSDDGDASGTGGAGAGKGGQGGVAGSGAGGTTAGSGAGGVSAGGSSAGGKAGAAGTTAGISGNSGQSGAGGSSAGAGAGGASVGGAAGVSAGGANAGGANAGGANAGGANAGGANAGGANAGGANAGGANQSGAGGSAGGPECTSSSECSGGVCVSGSCCASAAQVCAGECCQAGQACVFDQCVTPGASCQTSNDCQAGEYCETSLSPGGAGTGGAGGAGAGGGAGAAVCSQPLPEQGKCLALPLVCDGNGQPAGCVGQCEYVPKAGKLDAVEKWSWGAKPAQFPGRPDVWSTPTVGRLADANCDGKVDASDPPDVVFVSGNNEGTCCHCNGKVPTSCHTGVLRVLDGRTGQEIWSNAVPVPGSPGFSGVSVALGDLDGDQRLDVAAVDGNGFVVVFDGAGKLLASSDKPLEGADADVFGWGGGLSLADLDADGSPEIIYGRTVYTTKTIGAGTLTQVFVGKGGRGGTANHTALSFAADLDGDGKLELVAGQTAYRADGTILWERKDLSDGFAAVGDFDGDKKPEVVLVRQGQVHLLQGDSGVDRLPPFALPGQGDGGPPTVADFDGDKGADIGVAQQNFYSVLHVDVPTKTISLLWKTANHDLSSSVTGSSVFDFEGDGKAEVIYNDECFLWVFDGKDGSVRFATSTSSFTGTESSVVADIDGDGHAEILLIGNSANPGAPVGGNTNTWKCDIAPWNQPDPVTGRPAWKPGPASGATFTGAYRGLRAYGDSASSWVGTRSLWNQHSYHVTNICSGDDSACVAGSNTYGAIPKKQRDNWALPWLNNFRQNVQEKGLFNAPDAIVSLSFGCDPAAALVSVKNVGLAPLPAGVVVEVKRSGGPSLGQVTTSKALGPGQTESLTLPLAALDDADSFEAAIVLDPKKPLFLECREDNNSVGPVQPACIKP